jgi:5-methyltetrahydropteroyltriglutamate--homocysteine methyltransferase
MPGVASHATNIVEHPELIAARILRYAGIFGKERVIAGTDCGLGHRVHPELVWAKFSAMAEGARIATKALWG